MREDIDGMVKLVRQSFLSDLPSTCDLIERLVLAMEAGDATRRARLAREVHSLKGAAATVGLRLVADICHEFETFLGDTEGAFDEAQTTAALSCVDLIRRAGLETHTLEVMIREELDRIVRARPKRGHRILLVELSRLTATICQGKLKTLPIEIDVCVDEFSALNLLQTNDYDLLICAGQLTAMTAVEWLALLRDSDVPNRDIAVILATDSPPPKAAALGVVAHIPRTPELPDALLQQVRRRLELRV
jgi:HPt (histidine-containing phosphotransfer) domain-containing protein/CheY-like chemotaxis protein